MTTLIMIVLYILTILINRQLNFQLIKLDEDNVDNPMGKLFIFLHLLGTMLFIALLLTEMKESKFTKWFTHPKHLRK